MCMSILSACMYIHYMCRMAFVAKEVIRAHKIRVRDGCEPTDKGTGNDPDPLKE